MAGEQDTLGAIGAGSDINTGAGDAHNAEVQPGTGVEAAAGDKDWSHVIVVAGGALPAKPGKDTVVLVVQTRERSKDEAPLDDKGRPTNAPYGTHRNPSSPPLKHVSYPDKADGYVRLGLEADFGDRAPVITIGPGGEFEQGGFGGLSEKGPSVHVGPGNPVFAAVNIAVLKGAKSVKIVGLDESEAAMLEPWFAEIAEQVKIDVKN